MIWMNASFKRNLLWSVLLLVAIGFCASLFVVHNSSQLEKGRKRDADAQVIATELKFYSQENNGELPSSLSELPYDHREIDLRPFVYHPKGSNIGHREVEVLAEAKSVGSKLKKIIIYRTDR